MPFPEAPARANTQYERGVLPRGMQTVHIVMVVGGTEPVTIPVQVEDPRGLASYPPQRKVPTLRSRAPSPGPEMWDVPFPEVEQSRKRATPPRDKRSHERAFSTRSAHVTCVSSSTTSSVQGQQRGGGSDDDTDRSLFTRLAVPPAVVPPKRLFVTLLSRYFVPSDLLADVEPWMSFQLFSTNFSLTNGCAGTPREAGVPSTCDKCYVCSHRVLHNLVLIQGGSMDENDQERRPSLIFYIYAELGLAIILSDKIVPLSRPVNH
ncbi:hypothetical protein F5146DRAFT_537774 [Armillaria mellea]|nr:hypothetical protein F5146DRAFT_537774 [Armillaria mellea]